MKIFYIRHAPTMANINGEIVDDYDGQSIVFFDKDKWHEKVGSNLPKDFKLFISPAKRCKETAKVLFPDKDYTVIQDLAEFDLSELNKSGQKFWEIDEETFNKYVFLPERSIINRWLNALGSMLCKCDSNDDTVVVIGHGFYGRLVNEIYQNNDDSVFDILNSKNFSFGNLDMMEINKRKIVNVWRYKDEVVSC